MSGHPVLPAEPIALPLLPLRDVVVFPHMMIPLFVGRPKSVKALEAGMKADRQVMLVAQKASGKNDPCADDMFEIGCMATILQMSKLPDGNFKILLEGDRRASAREIGDNGEHFVAQAVPIPAQGETAADAEALRHAVTQRFDQYVKLSGKIPPERLASIAGINDAGHLADTIAALLRLRVEAAQSFLESFSVARRLEKLLKLLDHEVDSLQVDDIAPATSGEHVDE